MARKRRGRRMARFPQSACQWNQRLAKVFGKRIGRRSSLTAASEALGLPVGQMHRVKVHKLGGRPMEMLGGLVAIGDENPPDLYHEALEEIPRNHVAILACSRENQGLEPSAFLVGLTLRLRDLVAAGREKSGSWRCQLVLIRCLESERLNDWKQAAVKLEWILGLLLFFVEKKGRRMPEAFADIACALIALAAAYRIGGRRDDANDILRMTRPLVDLAGFALVEGLWLQKSGYLLVDLNRCDRAYEFFQEAAVCFIAAGASREQAQTLVDLGYVLHHAGQSEAALSILQQALNLLPADEKAYIFAVHQIRSVELQKLGRLEEASAEIGWALGVAADFNLGRASLHWSRARLSSLRQNIADAICDYESALDLYRAHGGAADLAEVTLEFAELLATSRLREELLRLAEGTALWLGPARGSSKIRAALESFLALVRLKKLDAGAIAEIRKELPLKSKPAPSCRRRAAQPPGGKAIPISGSVTAAPGPLCGSTSPFIDSSPASDSPIPTKNEIN